MNRARNEKTPGGDNRGLPHISRGKDDEKGVPPLNAQYTTRQTGPSTSTGHLTATSANSVTVHRWDFTPAPFGTIAVIRRRNMLNRYVTELATVAGYRWHSNSLEQHVVLHWDLTIGRADREVLFVGFDEEKAKAIASEEVSLAYVMADNDLGKTNPNRQPEPPYNPLNDAAWDAAISEMRRLSAERRAKAAKDEEEAER